MPFIREIKNRNNINDNKKTDHLKKKPKISIQPGYKKEPKISIQSEYKKKPKISTQFKYEKRNHSV